MALSKVNLALAIVLPILLLIGIIVIVYLSTKEEFDNDSSGTGGDTGGGSLDPEIPNNPFIFAYDTNVVKTRVGSAITISPEALKVEPQSMDVKPPLPDGLTIVETTGVISGTPTNFAESAVTYEVTASSGGDILGSATVTIEVLDVFPNFEYLGFPPEGLHMTNGMVVNFPATMIDNKQEPEVQHWTRNNGFIGEGIVFYEETGQIAGTFAAGIGFDNIINIQVINGSGETQEFHMRFSG